MIDFGYFCRFIGTVVNVMFEDMGIYDVKPEDLPPIGRHPTVDIIVKSCSYTNEDDPNDTTYWLSWHAELTFKDQGAYFGFYNR